MRSNLKHPYLIPLKSDIDYYNYFLGIFKDTTEGAIIDAKTNRNSRADVNSAKLSCDTLPHLSICLMLYSCQSYNTENVIPEQSVQLGLQQRCQRRHHHLLPLGGCLSACLNGLGVRPLEEGTLAIVAITLLGIFAAAIMFMGLQGFPDDWTNLPGAADAPATRRWAIV